MIETEPDTDTSAMERKENSSLHVLLGLVVIWASLMIVFQAHRLSDMNTRCEDPIRENTSHPQSPGWNREASTGSTQGSFKGTTPPGAESTHQKDKHDSSSN